jgi:hypothetical protein
MNRRLLTATLALVTALGAVGCSGGQPTGADVATAATSSPSGPPSGSVTPDAPDEPTAAPTTAGQANPGGGGAAPPPPPPASSQDPNAAFCQTFESILALSFQFVQPAMIIENSTDPAEVERAWQDVERIAREAAALSRQAVGQTTDANLKAVAQALATQFDHVATAAAARDKRAFESASELPEPPDGTVCGF